MTTVADDLRAAADHLETVGWIQGALVAPSATGPLEQSPCCAGGALAVVTGVMPYMAYFGQLPPGAANRYTAAVNLLSAATLVTDGLMLQPWNDAEGRTVEEVTTLLRSIADRRDRIEAALA